MQTDEGGMTEYICVTGYIKRTPNGVTKKKPTKNYIPPDTHSLF